MTGRQWQPGDIALLDSWRGEGQIAFRTENPPVWCVLDGRDTRGLDEHEVTAARPLVVINPEDREQVERLLAGWFASNGAARPQVREGETTRMQAALHSLVAPPIPEPMLIGAVISDKRGTKYVRVSVAGDGWMGGKEWQQVGGNINAVRNFGWADLDVAEVLYGGWTPDA